MRVGLVEFRAEVAENLSGSLNGCQGIEVLTFSSEDLSTDYIELEKNSPFNLYRTLSTNKCDVYLFGEESYLKPVVTGAVMALLRRIRFGIHLVAWFEDDIATRAEGRALGGLMKKIFRAAYLFVFNRSLFIITNSRKGAELMVRNGYADSRRIFPVLCGIDYRGEFTAGARDDTVDEFHILTVSNANFTRKTHGLFTIIEAFDIVAACSTATLTIAVSASGDRGNNNVEQVKKKIGSSAFARRIRLLVNVDNMKQLYRDSHIFVYHTPDDTSDGLPRVILEAQACSLPVIVGNKSGCPEAVSHGRTGFVVEGSPASFAEKIVELIEDSRLRNEMARSGPGWVETEFSWDKMAAEYAKILVSK